MSSTVVRKTIQYVVFTSIGVILFWYAIQRISWEEFITNLQSTNYYLVGCSLVAGLLGYVSRAVRWKILIESLGHKPGIKDCYNSLMLGYLANFVFPRIGEITRCAMLGKRKKIPVDQLIGTVILERAFDLVMLIILLLVLFIGKYDAFGPFIVQGTKSFFINAWEFATQKWWFAFLLVIIIIASVAYLRKNRRRILRFKAVRKFYRGIRGVNVGIKTILRLQKSTKFIFHTLFIWLMYWSMTYFVVLSMPITHNLSPLDGLFLTVMGGIGMSLPVQGGIGAFHTIVMLSLGLYGIDAKDGVSFAVLLHESQALFGILLGLISVFLFYISGEKKLILKPDTHELP
ncbi:MAG: flippase-like domain-containing protein [Bacteroidetes bacterium]|nr:flippase-like domain-containing protein [Bacteroidota bacterium]